MRHWQFAAVLACLLTACAAPPLSERTGARLHCLQQAQADVPGGHGAYGGFHQDRHPYDLLPETLRSGDREQTAFIDPYFRVGEETVDPRAYRGCLLRERPPG